MGRSRIILLVVLLAVACAIGLETNASGSGGFSTASTQEHAEPAEQDDHGDAAGGDEHAAEAAHQGLSWTVYAQRWINFVMLVGLLYWLLVVPPAFVVENFEFRGLKPILGERAAAIVAARALSKQQREETASSLAASAERLSNVENEITTLLGQANTDAENDRQRAEGRAAEAAEAIRGSAQRDMRSEVARSRRELQTHVADNVIGIAARLLERHFTAEDQQRLMRRYLDKLGETIS